MRSYMRGPIWSFFFIGCCAALLGGVLMLLTGTQPEKVNAILIIVVAGLYIAAYLALPRYLKPKPLPPAAPEQTAALAVPARLTLVRDASPAGALIPTIVFLNGEQACSMKNGETAQILLRERWNILLTNSAGAKGVRYEFEASDGAIGELHVRGGVFQTKTVRWG